VFGISKGSEYLRAMAGMKSSGSMVTCRTVSINWLCTVLRMPASSLTADGRGGIERVRTKIYGSSSAIIGEGSVLGLGSVATRDLEAWSVYAGVPAVKIRPRQRTLSP
jgi:hypothetical protein